MVLNDVVLTNFSLTNPTRDAQVMWPRGLISPGLQPGTTLPRRLYMQDVQLLVDGGTLQQYLRFFTAPGPNNTLVYTVSKQKQPQQQQWQQQQSMQVQAVARSSAAAGAGGQRMQQHA